MKNIIIKILKIMLMTHKIMTKIMVKSNVSKQQFVIKLWEDYYFIFLETGGKQKGIILINQIFDFDSMFLLID